MENKDIQFNGQAGDFFVVYIIVLITYCIPVFGWPIAFNYMTSWIVDHTTIRGEKISYSAGYVETLKFLFINTLLTFITFGIWSFWFIPKTYRYIAAHATIGGSAAPTTQPTVAAPPPAPDAPVFPSTPVSTPPVAPTVVPDVAPAPPQPDVISPTPPQPPIVQ